MAEDALDHGWAVDQRNDTHFFLAFRTQERVGFPDFLDEFTPFRRRDAARVVVGYIDDLHGLRDEERAPLAYDYARTLVMTGTVFSVSGSVLVDGSPTYKGRILTTVFKSPAGLDLGADANLAVTNGLIHIIFKMPTSDPPPP